MPATDGEPAATTADPAPATVVASRSPWAENAWQSIAVESAVSFLAASLFLVSCLLIRVSPLDRLGQISGLASLAFRFVLFSIAIVVALVVAARAQGGRGFDRAARLACAVTAGIATGMIGGGILVALYGTPWGLNGRGGDVGALASWATALHRGKPIPPTYPPLSLHILHIYTHVTGLTPDLALKHMEIAGVAAAGPIAYTAWRPLLRAPWALAVGVVAAIPLIEPYKPFPNLVLVVFVPLAIVLLRELRRGAAHDPLRIARSAVGFGLGFGVLCLMYSGWFEWAVPGLFVAALVVFPWKTAPRRGALLIGVTAVVFLLVCGEYLAGLFLDPAGKIADSYVYFDVKTEPMYIAMWRNDTPGTVGVWPPIGELGGVGLFSLLLAGGLGLAIAVARRTTTVIALGTMMTGAWLMRMFYARQLADTKLVQLYPRTTPLILYCLMMLGGYAVMRLVRRLPAEHVARGRSALIGALCTLLLVFASVGTATSDRYMPVNSQPPSAGWLTYNAYLTKWAAQRVYKARPQTWTRRPLP